MLLMGLLLSRSSLTAIDDSGNAGIVGNFWLTIRWTHAPPVPAATPCPGAMAEFERHRITDIATLPTGAVTDLDDANRVSADAHLGAPAT